jgi:CHAT domain-containing protein
MTESLRDLAAYHFNEARELIKQNQPNEALKDLKIAEEIALKEKANDIFLLSRTAEGQIMQTLGEYKKAFKIHALSLQAAEKLLSNDSDNELFRSIFQTNLSAIATLGNLFYDMGFLLQAQSCYELYALISKILPEKNRENVSYQSSVGTNLMNLGNLLAEEECFEYAKQSYEKALELKEKLLEIDHQNLKYLSDVAMILYNLGNLLWDMGYFNEAKKRYEKSLDISEKILKTDPKNAVYQSDVGIALNDLGALLWHMGLFVEAKLRYEEALKIREKLLKTYPENILYQSQVGTTLNNLGTFFRDIGLTEEALLRYERALEIREKILEMDSTKLEYKSDIGATLNNLGNLLWEMNHLGEAEKKYNGALDIYESLLEAKPENVMYKSELGGIFNNVGNVLWDMGNVGEAKQKFERALKIYEELIKKYPEHETYQSLMATTLLNLGSFLSFMGYLSSKASVRQGHQSTFKRYTEEAEQRYKTALEIYKKLIKIDPKNIAYKSSTATILNNLGNLLREKEKYLAAIELHSEALDYALKSANLNPIFKSYADRGRSFEKLGYYDEAFTDYKEAIKYIESIRNQYSVEENKIDTMWNKSTPYENIISLLCTKKNDLEKAWEYLGRFKARTLLESLRFLDLEEPKNIPKELLLDEKRLLVSIRFFDKQIRRATKVSEVAQKIQEIREEEAKLDKVYDEIQKFSPEYVDFRKGQPLGIKEMKDLIGNQTKKTAFIEYCTMTDTLFIFVIKSDEMVPKVKIVDLTEKNLLKHFEEFSKNVVITHKFGEVWEKLSSYLIDPVFKYINDCELIYLIPHGLLHNLPLHALYAENKHLIEYCPIVYAPSLTALKYSQSKSARNFESCLSIGYTANENEVEIFEGEARLVAELFNVEPKLGTEATSSILKNANYDVIHISCHGIFDGANPLNSGLKLKDKDLRLKEIYDLDLNASLLVLSACKTGLNEQKSGDEQIGLTRAFLYAGVRSLMVSLWSIDADSTLKFMETFYKKIKEEKKNRDEAFQITQVEFINNKLYSDSYLWAPFILIGA